MGNNPFVARSAGRRRSVRYANLLALHAFDVIPPPPPPDPSLSWFTETFRVEASSDILPVLSPGDFDDVPVPWYLPFDEGVDSGNLERPLQGFHLNMRFLLPPPAGFHLEVRFNAAWTSFTLGAPWADYVDVTDYQLNVSFGTDAFRTWVDPLAHHFPGDSPPPTNPALAPALAYGGLWAFLRGTTGGDTVEVVHMEFTFWRGV